MLVSIFWLTTGTAAALQPELYNMSITNMPVLGYNADLPQNANFTQEELFSLRRQVGKLQRRINNIEESNEARKKREKVLYFLGIVFIAAKTYMWLNRK